jgi:chromosome partitioning protein
MPLAQEARKPIFALTTADGAFGGHLQAARDAYSDFKLLADSILSKLQSS